MSPAGWVYPRTWSDRANDGLRAAAKGLLAAFGALSLLLLVVWGVPTVAVVNSGEWQTARTVIVQDPSLTFVVGHPAARTISFPERYRLSDGDEPSEFTARVQGLRPNLGLGQARVTVEVAGERAAIVDVEPLW